MIPERRRLWFVIAAIIAAVIAFGALTFLLIREPGEKPWDYGTVEFVPGASQYSIHRETR